ncbi:hypothetical protein Bdt_1791 [Bdellovibrio bacteriovorus str. Tiberius]|uniref:DNA-binding domain-containing protein n=1 Tax=Bdellovibrio bacteriovorus str. Tiberius TaxID=1069642 RepID=K7YXQ2_BDEBC|nr:hypothetical protein Bdt_1791 [Bdellovibrio bacteriovorus str. Tiberius]
MRDIDIVGVGAFRRHQLEILSKSKNLIVQTHGMQIPEQVSSIYQAELLRTLEWLRPFKVTEGERLNLREEQERLFESLFPRTREHLGVAVNRLRDEYLENMEWSSWLLQDHWRYFVGYLRQKFPGQADILELAHWEWVQAWIEVQPFDSEGGEEPGVLSLNPSLQVVILSRDNLVLNRDKGMYAFVYSGTKHTVVERPLDVVDSLFIDLLQEDRKYSKKQLLEMAAISFKSTPPPSSETLEKKFLSLLGDDIIRDVPT